MSLAPISTKILAVIDAALLAAGIAMIAWSPMEIAGDAESRYRTLDEWMASGHVNNTSYSFSGPVLAAPLWKLGDTPEARLEYVDYFNLIVFAVAAICLFAAFREHLGPDRSGRFLLLLLFATGFPHELQNFNNEVLSSLALGCGLIGLYASRRLARGFAGGAIVLATVNMPGLAIGTGLALLGVVERTRKLRWLIIPALCAGGIMSEAWLRRGSPWLSGYEGNAGFKTPLPYSGLPEFSYPFLLGLISIVFSFGKGLLFFYPGAFVRIRPWLRDETILNLQRAWLLAVTGLVLLYARWWSWYGGFCWGPRFFLFAALPSCLALSVWSAGARSILSCLAASAIIGWCLWVGYSGLVFALSDLDICSNRNYRLEAFCWYVPEFSPLIRPFITARALTAWEENALYLFYAVYLRITLRLWLQAVAGIVRAVRAAPAAVGAWLREARL